MEPIALFLKTGKLDRMNVSAPTAAMADAYERHESKISDQRCGHLYEAVRQALISILGFDAISRENV